MTLASVLARGRSAAERIMTDTCTVEELATETTGADGTVARTWTSVYSGRCRVQQQSDVATRQEGGEADLLLVRRVLALPVGTSAAVRVGQRVTVTACPGDPDLVGRRFWLHDESAKSHATARRLGIEEVTG